MSPRRLLPRDELDDIVEWRARRLRGAGFDAATAHALAADPTFDVHALLELIERGCPPDLAVRIVAPLE